MANGCSPAALVYVSVDVQSAVLQVLVYEALRKLGTTGVLPAFGDVANAQWWCVGQ